MLNLSFLSLSVWSGARAHTNYRHIQTKIDKYTSKYRNIPCRLCEFDIFWFLATEPGGRVNCVGLFK